MDISNKYLRVQMPDGTQWDVSVMKIAEHRAENFKEEFGNDLQRSLQEDTIPLFEDSSAEVLDWAANNMNWSDVEQFAYSVPAEVEPTDYQHGWVNGIVAVNGELLELYKLEWNEQEKRRVVPNPGYTVTKSATSLIRRMNTLPKPQDVTTKQAAEILFQNGWKIYPDALPYGDFFIIPRTDGLREHAVACIAYGEFYRLRQSQSEEYPKQLHLF